MSASATTEVATKPALTFMEVMFAPALVATGLTLTDTHVKVSTIILAGIQACNIIIIVL